MPGTQLTGTQRYPGAWHAVVDFLRSCGTRTVFGLPADDLVALRALEDTDIRFLLTRDQRNAGFMATGHALQTGRPAVCLVGKGPASSNVLTGLLEARCSAAPVVVLAAGTAGKVRGSGAFQELDQVSMVRSLVKWAYRVDHPDRVVAAVEKAFLAATDGTPGPVYLEIADDLLDTEVVRQRPWRDVTAQYPAADDRANRTALDAVRASRRPVMLVGGGMRHRNADRVLEDLAGRTGAAVFATASGRGAFDESHASFCGLAGLYSPPEAAQLWQDTDLVIALGSRLEETATFGAGFAPAGVEVLQVNVCATELSTEFSGPAVIADGGAVVRDWCAALSDGTHTADEDWLGRIGRAREQADTRVAEELARLRDEDAPHIATLLSELSSRLTEEHVLVQENGLQDMWSYFYPFWRATGSAGSIVPSEQTSLGFGAAAAAGVKLAAPDRTVVALVGDGAFGMLGRDLGVVADEGIGVLYVVLNNGGYGWLQSQLDKLGAPNSRFRFVSEQDTLGVLPDGVHHAVVRHSGELAEELDRALKECSNGRVAVLEIPVALTDVPADLSELEGDFPAQEGGH